MRARAKVSISLAPAARPLRTVPLVNAASREAEQALVATSSYRRLRRSLVFGVVLSAVPFVILIGWLGFMPIPGAVIASGYLTSASAPKEIQSAQIRTRISHSISAPSSGPGCCNWSIGKWRSCLA